MRFIYDRCEIIVKGDGDEFTLDLSNDKCKETVSLKVLFRILTKQNPDESTNRFATFEKFGVDEIKIKKRAKDVSFKAKSVEPFEFMHGGQLQVFYTFTFLDNIDLDRLLRFKLSLLNVPSDFFLTVNKSNHVCNLIET